VTWAKREHLLAAQVGKEAQAKLQAIVAYCRKQADEFNASMPLSVRPEDMRISAGDILAIINRKPAPQGSSEDDAGSITAVPMVCTVCRQPVKAGSQRGLWFHADSGNPANCSRIVPVRAMVAAGNENVARKEER